MYPFTSQAEIDAFRARCHVVKSRGLSASLLAEGLSIGPQWLDEFERLTEEQLRDVSRLHANVAALSASLSASVA